MRPDSASITTRLPLRLPALALLVGLGLAPGLQAQAASYEVAIDTASISGRAGSVDLQWNVAAADAGLRASVGGFAGPALVGSAVLLPSGDVTGSFAATGAGLDFGGRSLYTYIYQPVAFGAGVSFILTLPDQAPVLADATGGSVFSVSLLGDDALPLLPAEAASGASLRFDLAPGAGPAVTAFSAAVTVTAIPAAVPEPSTWATLLLGLVALATWRARPGKSTKRPRF